MSGNYKIEAWGAKGGGSNGGKGAKISGNFTLTANETINIIVGQKGTVTNQGSSFGAGGGGGTYVYRSLQNLLIANHKEILIYLYLQLSDDDLTNQIKSFTNSCFSVISITL